MMNRLANEVIVRVQGAVIDRHAAEARYNRNCSVVSLVTNQFLVINRQHLLQKCKIHGWPLNM